MCRMNHHNTSNGIATPSNQPHNVPIANISSICGLTNGVVPGPLLNLFHVLVRHNPVSGFRPLFACGEVGERLRAVMVLRHRSDSLSTVTGIISCNGNRETDGEGACLPHRSNADDRMWSTTLTTVSGLRRWRAHTDPPRATPVAHEQRRRPFLYASRAPMRLTPDDTDPAAALRRRSIASSRAPSSTSGSLSRSFQPGGFSQLATSEVVW